MSYNGALDLKRKANEVTSLIAASNTRGNDDVQSGIPQFDEMVVRAGHEEMLASRRPMRGGHPSGVGRVVTLHDGSTYVISQNKLFTEYSMGYCLALPQTRSRF